MLQCDLNDEYLPVYEALASKVRLKILRLLCQRKMNVKELAAELGLSSSIMTMHIRKLEAAGLIKTELSPGKSGQQKVSAIAVNEIGIRIYENEMASYKCHKSVCPVGHYTDFDVEPTCGLASDTEFIGNVDDSRYFMDPKTDGRQNSVVFKRLCGVQNPQFPGEDPGAGAGGNQHGVVIGIPLHQR